MRKLTNISWLFYLPISVNHLVFRCEGMIHRYPEIKIDSNIGKWFTVSFISFPDIGMPIYRNQRMSWFTNMGKSKWYTDIDSSIKIQIERGKTMSMEKGVHCYLVKSTNIWVSPNTTGTIDCKIWIIAIEYPSWEYKFDTKAFHCPEAGTETSLVFVSLNGSW